MHACMLKGSWQLPASQSTCRCTWKVLAAAVQMGQAIAMQAMGYCRNGERACKSSHACTMHKGDTQVSSRVLDVKASTCM